MYWGELFIVYRIRRGRDRVVDMQRSFLGGFRVVSCSESFTNASIVDGSVFAKESWFFARSRRSRNDKHVTLITAWEDLLTPEAAAGQSSSANHSLSLCSALEANVTCLI